MWNKSFTKMCAQIEFVSSFLMEFCSAMAFLFYKILYKIQYSCYNTTRKCKKSGCLCKKGGLVQCVEL